MACGKSGTGEVAHVDGIRRGGASQGELRVLAFVKTSGFRHGSIPDAIVALEEIGNEAAFAVDTTEDATIFAEGRLAPYRVVVFALTTGDVLAPTEEAALESFVRKGGGFVGLHSATDTEHAWPFYGELVGARFARHPPGVHGASIVIEDTTHPSTKDLPKPRWQRTDEWYDFDRNPRPDVHVLLRVDESTYRGGGMGTDHPIAWTREIDQGRVFVTALGHPSEAWRDPELRAHVKGGILWAAKR
jgi:type 1 glutamine amidotransferase